MAQRFYPAVLERGARDTLAVWFPDFPGCVAGATTQEDAMARAQEALSNAVAAFYEREADLPEPTPFERIKIPKDCDLVTFVAIGVDPPDPSERVNVYLPASLVARADRRAAELGMSRSSYFGLALSWSLGVPGALRPGAKLPPNPMSVVRRNAAQKPPRKRRA